MRTGCSRTVDQGGHHTCWEGRGGLWHTDDTKQLYIILIKAWKIKDVHALVRMDEKNVVAIQGPRYIVIL